jgi:hypothetical protein
MGAGLCALEHGGPETPRAADGSAHSSRPSSETVCSLRPTLAPIERSMPATEDFIVEAADSHDAEQGYPWRWEVIYGEAHRSGACQTRVQAEREAATVLVLLGATERRARDLA